MSAWQAAAACECASTRAQMWNACMRKRDADRERLRQRTDGEKERESKAKKQTQTAKLN